MKKAEKKIKAWWFAARDPDGKVRLPHGDGREVVVGETLSVEGKIVACKKGLHASVRPLDALQYAPGGVVCRVEVWGDVRKESDKIAGRNRKVLWMADADSALRLFACDCAKEACRVAKHTDERSLNAIRVARLYAEGRATSDELAAALDAALDAAWVATGAAWDAAWAARVATGAAWDAAWAAWVATGAAWDATGAARVATGAAWDAAGAAARAAAWDAAGDAARTAAWDAAGDARAAAWDAGAAVRAAAWDAQNKALTKRLMALRRLDRVSGGKP